MSGLDSCGLSGLQVIGVLGLRFRGVVKAVKMVWGLRVFDVFWGRGC